MVWVTCGSGYDNPYPVRTQYKICHHAGDNRSTYRTYNFLSPQGTKTKYWKEAGLSSAKFDDQSHKLN